MPLIFPPWPSYFIFLKQPNNPKRTQVSYLTFIRQTSLYRVETERQRGEKSKEKKTGHGGEALTKGNSDEATEKIFFLNSNDCNVKSVLRRF